MRHLCNIVNGENSSVPQLHTRERKKSGRWQSAPCRGSRTCRSQHVLSCRAPGIRGPAAPAPTHPVKRSRSAQKDRAGQPGCHWNSCLGRASQLEKAKREYSTFKGVNSPAVYFFLRKRLVSSKLPEHALGLEVGGKRKGKCKPRSKSLLSTDADAKLKLFFLSSSLIL